MTNTDAIQGKGRGGRGGGRGGLLGKILTTRETSRQQIGHTLVLNSSCLCVFQMPFRAPVEEVEEGAEMEVMAEAEDVVAFS